ncbi:MAG TPA: hypothetical protein DCM87_17380 [Planctomycetes bacterium]|nr:hypothetical protein [Planctomycetota bacterium]
MRRVRIIAILGCAAFLFLMARLASLQLFGSARLQAEAALRDSDVRMLPALRCAIKTSAGEILAEDRHVIDLVITAGALYPDRAACILLADQIDRARRRAEVLGEPLHEPLPGGMDAQALLDRWARSAGRECVRLAADLTAAQAERLRPHALALVPPGAKKSAVLLRLGKPLPGLPVPRELWFDITALGMTLGAEPLWSDLLRAITGSVARLRGGAHFLAELEETLGGRPDGAAFPAIDYEGRRACTVVKEAEIVPPILSEDEGRRLLRHTDLRRRYFRGVQLRAKEEGGLFTLRRTYGVVFTRERRDVCGRLQALAGREGFGSAALSAEFRRNAQEIIARMDAMPRRADAFFRRKFEEKRPVRSPDIAWELAEVWRARYLEHALFTREQLLIADLGAYGDDGVRLLELLPAGVPIAVRSRYVRRYPQGESVGSLVGLARPWELAVDADSPEALAAFQDEVREHRDFLKELRAGPDVAARFSERRRGAPPLRTPGDAVGIQGIERDLDARLRGLAGLQLAAPGERIHIPPLAGNDAELVIDLGFTRAMYGVLEDAARGMPSGYACRSGIAIVMDLENGDLLCLASYPSFDPDRYLSRDPRYLDRLAARAKDAPLWNHCFFPVIPGSVFKLVVAGAFLEEGGSPGTAVYCKGRDHPDYHCPNHGLPDGDAAWNLHEAIKRSCNHYFVDLGTRRLGRDKLVGWMGRFGFNGAPAWLPPELRRSGAPDYAAELRDLRYYMCYGSGEIRVLPLVMLRFVAAIARGGSAPRPRLRADAPVVHDTLPLRPASCEVLRKAMRAVVAEYPGTAHKPECGLFPAFNAAVKTGTAELDPRLGTNNAWIVGFAPHRAPRYAFVVCLEHVARGGHGGETAGPVAAAALKYLDRANPALGLRAAGTQ